MAIGERIKFIRNLHGATQKWLGLKPKDEMIKDIANIFGVSPQAIKLPDIDNYNALLHTLFAIEDIYGLTVNMLDDELCLTLDRENSSYFPVYDMLRAWNKVARKYRNGVITKEEYDNWRYNYPESKI